MEKQTCKLWKFEKISILWHIMERLEYIAIRQVNYFIKLLAFGFLHADLVLVVENGFSKTNWWNRTFFLLLITHR